MLYDCNGEMLEKYPTIVGDGVTDDTTALQALVDTYESIRLPAKLKIKITNTITIDPSICRLFDGGGSAIIIDGNITGIEVSGSLTTGMTADPSTLTSEIIDNEAGFTICNCKMQGDDNVGTAIMLNGVFKPTVANCYIHHVTNGIVVSNICRDVNILGNQIYCCTESGILIDSTANLHQININDNIITYAKYCIHLDEPIYVANIQISGNDIEIKNYPSGTATGFRCIFFNVDTEDATLSTSIYEVEITGNTIQGHNQSNIIIEFTGGTAQSRTISDVSVVGNHISNAKNSLIALDSVLCATFSGNTFKTCNGYAFSVATNCGMIAIVGNECRVCGGFIEILNTIERLIIADNVSNTTANNPYNIVGTTIVNSNINNNIVSGSNTSMVVNPTNATRVMVVNNIVGSGTYTLHNDVTASGNI